MGYEWLVIELLQYIGVSLEELEFSVAFWTFLLNCVQLQNFIQHWISLTVGFADVLSP